MEIINSMSNFYQGVQYVKSGVEPHIRSSKLFSGGDDSGGKFPGKQFSTCMGDSGMLFSIHVVLPGKELSMSGFTFLFADFTPPSACQSDDFLSFFSPD